MTATFHGGDDKVKIVINPEQSDREQLQKFCDGGFLIAVSHYFASDKISCVTVESMNRMPENPHTPHHAE